MPCLALDRKRIETNRFDILCCLKSKTFAEPREDIVRKYFNQYFVPFVFKKTTKVLTIVITICFIIIGGFSCFKLLRGLDAQVSLVSGSDIFDYFNTLDKYGNAGPPGYLVFNNINYSDP